MSTFDRIAELKDSDGPQAAIDFLIGTLREEKNFHKLFDALLLKKKQELGLSLVRPTSLEDVPADIRPDFEKYYIASAREIGQLFLDSGQLNEAWLYFRTIQEPQAVAPLMEIYSSFARNFNLGKGAEDALEQFAEMAKQKAAAPQPNPQEELAKAAEQREQQRFELDVITAKEEIGLKRMDRQLKARELGIKEEQHGLEEDRFDLEEARAEMDAVKTLAEVDIEREQRRPAEIS